MSGTNTVLRGLALRLAAIVTAFAMLNFWGAWREYDLTNSLRTRGQVTTARMVRTLSSTKHRSGGNSTTSFNGIWRYSVAGKNYEIIDEGSLYSGTPVYNDRLGPDVPNQIVYLPDDPARARLRTQLEPAYFDLIGGGLGLLLAGFALLWFARRGMKRRA